MLSRIVRIPLRYSFSAVARPQFSSNVPQVVREVKKEVQQWGAITQESSVADLGQLAVNFLGEVDGKRLVLQSAPELRSNFTFGDVSTALLSMGAAYGILSNFNYVLTLGFVLGAAASSMTLGRLNWTRNEDIITAIEVDQTQRLHITYLGKSGYDNIIVDKNNFVYNVLKPGAHGTKAIWCKINGEDFCISKANLQVNSQQFHHLL